MSTLGDRIRKLRREKDLSQAKLGELIGGASNATISKYEKAIVTPDSNTLLNLANALGTTTDYLVGRVDDPMPEKETLEANFLFYDKENLTEEDEEYLNMIVETMKKRRANKLD